MVHPVALVEPLAMWHVPEAKFMGIFNACYVISQSIHMRWPKGATILVDLVTDDDLGRVAVNSKTEGIDEEIVIARVAARMSGESERGRGGGRSCQS